MLAACTRQLRTWGANGSHSVGASKYFAKNSKAAKVYSGKMESPKSLARVALRKYAEAVATQTEASSEAVVKKYNLELNKLAKLRNYDEANTLYEKMKQEGVTPNPTTYLIMFEAYLRWPDQILLGNMLEDLKAKGIKTQFAVNDAQYKELVAGGRPNREKWIALEEKIQRARQAGLNPFEPPK